MRKLNYAWLCLVYLLGITDMKAQIDTTSTGTLLLNGKIKKIQDYSYSLEPDASGRKTVDGKKFDLLPFSEDWNIEKESVNYSKTNISYTFDKKGQNVNVTTYFSENMPFGGMDFTYDMKGKIVKSQTIFSASDGDFTVDKTYFYNEKDQLVKIDEYEGKEWLLTYTFKYDDWGNCIEKNKVASISALEKDIQEYEEKNLILEKKIRTKYTKEKHYKYNKLNKVTKTEEFLPEHGIYLKVENEYDKDNNLVKSTYLNEDDQQTICVYKYRKGKLIQSICTATDDPDFYVETNFSYGSSGETQVIKTKNETVSKKVFNKQGLLVIHRTPEFDHQYKYSFDAKGNWKEVVLYENNIPSKVRVRKIEYY